MKDIWSLYRDDDYTDYNVAIVDALNIIDEQPTADVVEIVRCKDCKHYKFGSDEIRYCFMNDSDHLWQDDDYCSYGERREDVTDTKTD